jgi:hypothetical protein
MSRDRDPSGRPRNTRLRDALGRPLPRSAQARAARDGDARPEAGLPPAPEGLRVPEGLVFPDDLPPAETVRVADWLLRVGRPFHAHEVLEAAWKSGPAQERDLWQGLAQIAVGITHAHRGNGRGAVTLLRRGAERVRGYASRAHGEMAAHGDESHARGDTLDLYGIDVTGVLRAAEALTDRIERDGPDHLPLELLRPGLVGRTGTNKPF